MKKFLCNLNKDSFFTLEVQWITQTFHQTKRRNPIRHWISFGMWGWYTSDVSSLSPSCWKMVTTIMFCEKSELFIVSKVKGRYCKKIHILFCEEKIYFHTVSLSMIQNIIKQNFGNPHDFEYHPECGTGIRQTFSAWPLHSE